MLPLALNLGIGCASPSSSPLSPFTTAPRMVPAARWRGFKTIQLEVLVEAAAPPQPTGLAYFIRLSQQLMGKSAAEGMGFEALLTPVPGKGQGPMSFSDVWRTSKRSRWDVVLSEIRRFCSRRVWRPPVRAVWEDVDYWYGPPERDEVVEGRG